MGNIVSLAQMPVTELKGVGTRIEAKLSRIGKQKQLAPAIKLDCQQGKVQTLVQGLSFQLTPAQNRVIAEIYQDLKQSYPMMRLVQGDVGSGKTIVAACAALHVIDAGYQVALMAPTELLSEQHFRTFEQWLEPLGIGVCWLSSRIKGKARNEMMMVIQNQQIQLIVGTHSLFQNKVVFGRLGMIIVDEQHRFGVHQRLALREKGGAQGRYPHQLIMTATPIPRTLAMTAYADLDCSVIDQLPPGRTPVATVVIPDTRRQKVVARVYQACKEKRQAYWVCTLIDESEAIQCEAAEIIYQTLTQALPDLSIALVHGRMKAEEKERVMTAFSAARYDVLVATTVIEVGVNVPNASLMIIENAERMGLAQLHQMRGRVGRGDVKSYCVLMYKTPLTETAVKRLGCLRDTNDGFEIARHDLEIRGPGELLGTRQTGLLQFKISDILRDQYLLPEVQKIGDIMLCHYPQNAEAIMQRWIHHNVMYGNA